MAKHAADNGLWPHPPYADYENLFYESYELPR